MKRLDYTLIGEGIAENSFIPAYLENMSSPRKIKVRRSRLLLRNPSRSRVISHAEEFCRGSLVDNKENLFIAGIDLDETDSTDEQEVFHRELNGLKTVLKDYYPKHTYKDKIILFIPIQCFDHWLCYLKEGKSIKANKLESTHCDEVKVRIFGKNANRNRIEKVITTIIKSCDVKSFDELAKQSRSFRHFHEQVNLFLDKFS